MKKKKKARKPKYPAWYSGNIAEHYDIERTPKGNWRVTPKKPQVIKNES